MSLYIGGERERSPLSDDKKYWLLAAAFKHMDARGRSNRVEQPGGIYTASFHPQI